jgi:hypothetical protein
MEDDMSLDAAGMGRMDGEVRTEKALTCRRSNNQKTL